MTWLLGKNQSQVITELRAEMEEMRVAYACRDNDHDLAVETYGRLIKKQRLLIDEMQADASKLRQENAALRSNVDSLKLTINTIRGIRPELDLSNTELRKTIARQVPIINAVDAFVKELEGTVFAPINRWQFMEGDIVKCVNNGGSGSALTHEKTYKIYNVRKTDTDYITVTDDLMERTEFYATRFELVERKSDE